LDLFQQVSSFVNTDTGVNSSPTLNKRELRTSLTVEDGEVLVIGGLNDSKIEDAKSGLSFLPFALSKSHGSRSSELLLVLELKRI
jgi:type II secretory pathway component GspD/PulD (secretin)